MLRAVTSRICRWARIALSGVLSDEMFGIVRPSDPTAMRMP
jgi:hypothetical protein